MISVEVVNKKYQHSKVVLKDVSLECESGNIYTLVGKNGAGKSTLINAMAGLLSIDSGSIKIMRHKVSPASRSPLQQVGFVFEEHSLVEKFSAREQLEFTAKLYKLKNIQSKIVELLHLLELPADNRKYIESYSSGMRSKVAIACALIHSPDILIMDEPFRGLDIPVSHKLFKFLREYVGNNKCALITTHQTDIISELSDYVLILKEGQISSSLSFKEVSEASTIYSNERNPLGAYLEKCLE